MERIRVTHLHLVLFLHLLFGFSSSQTSLAYHCPANQQSALMQFKHESFSESPSLSLSKLLSWKPHTDCCSWEGITCDNATGDVIGLNLNRSELFGHIDSNSSLFKLGNLQRLDLSGIFFDFPQDEIVTSVAPVSFGFSISTNSSKYQPILIPSEFAQLAKLTHLNLASAGFSGQIPLELSQLTRLVSLDLSFNNLKLENPNLEMLIHNMSSLRELRLSGVDMSTGNKDWCKVLSSSLPSLCVLDLSNCSISSPVDSSLSNLRFLSEISLSGNNLSSEVPDFWETFSSLTSLGLSNCGLHGEFPKSIFRLPNLQKLDVSNNPDLLGSLPEFNQHSTLQELSLSFTRFYGKLPESIGNLNLLTDLLLESCNFSGAIPNSIANHTQLVYLDLSSNNFSGLIPLSRDSKLLNLQYLNLQNNSLEGMVNCTLFALPSLQVLDLGQNKFHSLSSEIPNMTFPLLRLLNLSNNELHGPIPRLIFEIRSLEELNLSSNKFNGSVDQDLSSNLKNLSRLDLSNNPLSAIADSNFAFPQLESLELHSCGITKFPNFLRNHYRLRYLDLSSNEIKGQIPSWIWMSSLTYLNLSQNLLTGLDGPLPDASSLQLIYLDLHSNNLQGSIPHVSPYASFLDYSNNEFTSAIPDEIFNTYPSNVTFFSVAGNKLIGEIPTSICSSDRLQILDLSRNNFSGTIPKCLGDTSNTLLVLNLGGNGFQGTMPHIYASSLRTLVFNGNQLEGMVPRSLSACKSLEVLDLGNNQIYGTFPSWLENLPRLWVLVLRSNKFYGPIGHPQTKNAFPMLHVIDLSFNAFTGHLPSQYFHSWNAMKNAGEENSQVKYLGSKYYHDSVTVTAKGQDILYVRILNIFTTVDLSKNEFQGKIPDSIGELKSLLLLNLSHNNLGGLIPVSLQKLTQLESLDLSKNKLSGEIPWQLTSLTFLSVLNLSQNELKGTIPRGSQFETFTATSYEGNLGLCGFPLSRICKGAGEALLPIQPNLDSGSISKFDWKFVMMGYGCGVVAGLSIGYIFFWRNRGCFATFMVTKCHSRPGNRQRRKRF